MKTTIIVENGKVTVQVEDGEPVEVKPLFISPPPIDLKPLDTKPDIRHTTGTPLGPQTVSGDSVGGGTKMETLAPARAQGVNTKLSTKSCKVCGIVFRPKTVRSRFCSAKCATSHYNAKHRAKAKEQDASWCKHCGAFTTHSTITHTLAVDKPTKTAPVEPEFLPGHEKTGEELESWRPEPITPGTERYSKADRDDTEAGRKKRRA